MPRGPALTLHARSVGALRRGNDFALCQSQLTQTLHLHGFWWLVQPVPEHPAMGIFLRKPLFYHLSFLGRLAVLAQRWMRITKVSDASQLCPEKGLGEMGASFPVHLGSSLYWHWES